MPPALNGRFTKPLHLAKNLSSLNEHVKDDSFLKQARRSTGALEKKKAVNQLVSSLPKVNEKARQALSGDDAELAYILLMRYLAIYMEIKKSEQFIADKNWAKKLPDAKKSMEELEALSIFLEARYEKLAEIEAAPVSEDLTVSPTAAPKVVNGTGKTKPVEQNGHSASKSVPDQPLFKSSKFVTTQELYELLKQKKHTVLLLDLREADQFISSQIIWMSSINVPSDRLYNKTLTASFLSQVIDEKCRAMWGQRHMYDFIVIVDSLGKTEKIDKGIADLISVLVEFSAEAPKSHPVILDGGFYDYLLRYPHGVSDPKTQKPRADIRMNIANVRFPSINIFREYSVPTPPHSPRPSRKASPLPQTSNSAYGAFYADAKPTVQPIAVGKPESKKAESASVEPKNVAAVSVNVIPKSMPVPNRSLKPASNTSLRNSSSEEGFPSQEKENVPVEKPDAPEPKSKRNSRDVDVQQDKPDVEVISWVYLTEKSKPVPKPPEVQRTTKPSFGLDRQNLEVHPGSEQDVGKLRSKSTEFADIFRDENTKIFDRPPSRTQSPFRLPAGEQRSPSVPDARPVVRDIPIVIERPDQPHVPEVSRVLKPSNLSVARRPLPRPDFSLKEYRQPSSSRYVSKPGLTGLYNVGNSCYMNAALQCLAHSKPLRHFYLKTDYWAVVEQAQGNPGSSRGRVSEAFAECLRLLWSGEYEYFAPKFLKAVLGDRNDMYAGNEMQDVDEAMKVIIDSLHQDTNTAPLVAAASREEKKKRDELLKMPENLPPDVLAVEMYKRHQLVTDSPIDNILSFMKETVLTCLACRYESYSFSMDQMLSMWYQESDGSSRSSSKSSLNELLDSAMQTDDRTQCEWFCPRCNRPRLATQRYYFRSFPKLLIIHLKRSSQSITGEFIKDERYLSVEHQLDCGRFVKGKNQAQQSQYRLYAVIDHLGTLQGGHYTAMVQHADSKKWYKFDDDRDPQNIGPDSVISNKAYVLFYEQVAS